MANIHALRDEISRNRVDLVSNLNKMFKEYPAEAKQEYELSLMHMAMHFDGNTESEPVQEQSKNLES